MAKAGFYAIESHPISFRRDGNWYSGDERIDHPRIALLFSRSLERKPDGSYFLKVGDERAPVTIEDTPYVVRSVERSRDGRFVLTLNDEQQEVLDPTTLEVGRDNVLYCRVKQDRFAARFLRPAYYHLSRYFEADDDGRVYLDVGGRRFLLCGAGNDRAGESNEP